MFTINTFAVSRLNNAEFTGFCINLQKAINNGDAEKLGLTAIKTPFDATLQKLIDQVYNTTGSEFTAAMQVADAKRVSIFRRIRLRLQMVLYAEENEALNACKDIVGCYLLAKYPAKIAQKAYHAKSAVIEGFLMDLRNKLDDSAIEALGISGDISNLEDANLEFINLYSKRTEERSAGDTKLTIKLRAEMYGYYQQICFTTQYLANTVDTTLAEKATACQDFIGVLNVILADAKKRYNQRLNGTAEDEETIEGDTDNADDASESDSNADSGSSASDSGSASGTSTNSGSSTSSDSGSSTSGSTSGSGSSSSSSSSGSSSTSTEGPSETGVVDENGHVEF